MVTFFIKTYGCQANVADSMHLCRYLISIGLKQVDSEEHADLIIINTCAIREKAEKKMFSYVGDLLRYKQQKQYLTIGIIGCVASYRNQYILRRFPYVDFVIGAREEGDKLKEYLCDAAEKISMAKSMLWAGQVFDGKFVPQTAGGIIPHTFERSMVNIMRGCNNYCSYCIVPFTKGRERSYPIKNILEQITQDIENGAKEVTLLGQNVNSYRDPDTSEGFEILLERVARLDGEFWVRFMSPHPKDMTTKVLEVMVAYPEKV